ncbi:DUF3908 family protein [Bacillus cereus]|uniref:DUF3908 family protein n=1 Tax=Bacillus TaxID=1386 RepID=UPI0009957F3E|nr:DUF3908 family protein [Bacillus cereus]
MDEKYYEFVEVKRMLWGFSGDKGFLYRKMINLAESILPLEKFKYIYSKNLVNYDDNIFAELYFFTDDKVYILKEENKDINLLILNIKDVKNIDFTISDQDSDVVKLNIEFDKGVIIKFDSLADSNSEWSREYKKIIMLILGEFI